PARSWSRARSRISWSDPVSSSTTAAPASSRECRASGGYSPSGSDLGCAYYRRCLLARSAIAVSDDRLTDVPRVPEPKLNREPTRRGPRAAVLVAEDDDRGALRQVVGDHRRHARIGPAVPEDRDDAILDDELEAVAVVLDVS